MAKLFENEYVTMDVLVRICVEFKCQISVIVEIKFKLESWCLLSQYVVNNHSVENIISWIKQETVAISEIQDLLLGILLIMLIIWFSILY